MTRKIKSRSESVFSAIFLLCQVRKTNCGKDSCFAGLFSVISRLSGVALAKTDVSRAKEIVILAGLLLAVNVSAQTPYYYLNRSFSSVQFNLQGIPTEYQLNEESDKLTDIVQGSIQLDTTGTYAIERQAAITICYNLSEDAWNAAVNYTGSTSIYTGKIFNNVGWVRGIKNTTPSTWGAYLWVLQNRIAFQASTSAWWSTTNGIPVAITNVMVGSLGDYQATSNVVDIGPHLNVATNNYPGANQSESKEFQVDITNVYYVLVIPDIWITPRFAVTCVNGSNVQYSVTGTNIPQGVTWSLIPDLSGSGGATFQSNGAWQAEVAPGSVATNYKVRATSKDNTNFYDQVDLDVLKVELEEVSFSGTKYHTVKKDDGSLDYTAPHWQDNSSPLDGDADDTGDKKYPLCFTRNTKMKVSVKWHIEPSNTGATIKVKGDGLGNLDFPETTTAISGNDMTVTDIECSNSFTNEVDFFDPMTITWQFSLDSGSTWYSAGTSVNQTYITLSDPSTTVYHTLAHLGCKNADGQSTTNATADAIYNEFTDRDVRRISDSKQMTYWLDVDGDGTNDQGAVNTSGILQRSDANGNCQAWSGLFRDFLRVQGITADRIKAMPVSTNDDSILVKNWQFNDPPSGSGSHPYIIGTDAIDLNGVPGQGNSNPPGGFNGHWITLFDNQYYDPSYGTTKVTGSNKDKAYEDGSLAGYGDLSGTGARKNDITTNTTSELNYQVDN